MAIAFPGRNIGPFGGPAADDRRMFEQSINAIWEGKRRQKEKRENQRQMTRIAEMMKGDNGEDFVNKLLADPSISTENKQAYASMAMMDARRKLAQAQAQPQQAKQKYAWIDMYNTKDGSTQRHQVPEQLYNQTKAELQKKLTEQGSNWRIGKPGDPKKPEKKTFKTLWAYNPRTKSWDFEEYEPGKMTQAKNGLKKRGFTKFKMSEPSSKDALKANEILIPDREGNKQKKTEGELRKQYAISHNIPEEWKIQQMEVSEDPSQKAQAREYRRQMAEGYYKWRTKVMNEGLPAGNERAPIPPPPPGFSLDK